MRRTCFFTVTKSRNLGDFCVFPLGNKQVQLEENKTYLVIQDGEEWLLIGADGCSYHTLHHPILQPIKRMPFLLKAMWSYAASLLVGKLSVDELKHHGSVENINKVLNVCQNTYILKGILSLDNYKDAFNKFGLNISSASVIKELFGLDSDVAVNIAFALLVDSKRGCDIYYKGYIEKSKTIDYPDSLTNSLLKNQ